MDYKKLIPSQELRFKILGLLNFIPDKLMIKIQYRIKTGRKLNLKKPERFTEKLQWYKLYYRNPLMTQGADKHGVRHYVESKGLGHILNNLYAVYNSPNEIKLDSLPNQFVMKTTNGSGTNYFFDGKFKRSLDEVKMNFEKWLSRNIFASGREWSYRSIQPKIIVEELIETDDKDFKGLTDYKFLCFNGKVEYIVVDVDRAVKHKRNIYDTEWNLLDVSTDHPNFNKNMPKPERLNEMLSIANKLSGDFPFVRVDLYYVNKIIYFGELTFYPWTGYVQFKPDEFDFILGDLFKLEKMMF